MLFSSEKRQLRHGPPQLRHGPAQTSIYGKVDGSWFMAKWMVQDLWQSGWFKIYERVDGSKNGARSKKPFPLPLPPPGGGGGGGGGGVASRPIFLNHPLCHKSRIVHFPSTSNIFLRIRFISSNSMIFRRIRWFSVEFNDFPSKSTILHRNQRFPYK